MTLTLLVDSTLLLPELPLRFGNMLPHLIVPLTTTSSWYRAMAFEPLRKRFDEFYWKLELLIKSSYPNQWKERVALQRLGLNKGQQLNDYALELIDKYDTLIDESKLNNSVKEKEPNLELISSVENSLPNSAKKTTKNNNSLWLLFILFLVIIGLVFLIPTILFVKNSKTKVKYK